jgi:hypothetical protein
MSTYSIYNLKIDNDIRFQPGITAGYVLSINADGTTTWVEKQGGGGATLSVDFIGLPATASIGSPIFLTASTIRDKSSWSISRDTGSVGGQTLHIIGYVNNYSMSGNYYSGYFTIPGTYSITLFQATASTGNSSTKQIEILNETKGIYITSTSPSGAGSNLLSRTTGSLSPINYNYFLSGTLSNPDSTLRKFKLDGTHVFSIPLSANVNGVDFDSSGNIYTVSNRLSNLTTRKYDSLGNILWSVDHGADVSCIKVDSSANVYTAGSQTTGTVRTTRKYDTSGTLLWSVDHGAIVSGIDVDANGNVYTAGNRVVGTVNPIKKYDSSGNLLWSYDHGLNCFGITVDPTGVTPSVYIAGNRSSTIPSTRKLSGTGSVIWSADHGASVGGAGTGNVIAIDGTDGNVYTNGVLSSNFTHRKYGPTGSLIWSVDGRDGTTGAGFGIDVDNSGNVYGVNWIISSTGTKTSPPWFPSIIVGTLGSGLRCLKIIE